MARIEDAMNYVMVNEGGYVNNPHDRGGPTNHGITMATLAAYRHEAVTIADMRALTISDVTPIYKHNYWDMLALDSISDQGCATALFDVCVNFGVGGAKLMLKRALMVLSQHTVNDCGPRVFIQALERIVVQHYENIIMGNPSQHVFYNGWMNRAHRLLSLI